MEPSTEKSARTNPLLAPFIGVSVLFVAAAGTAAVLWANQGHQDAPTATTTPAMTAVKEAAPGTAKAAPVSRFDTVAGHLDKGGTFYLYLDTAQWLGGLSKQLEALRDLALMAPGAAPQDAATQQSVTTGFTLINDLITKSGLQEIEAVGASSIAVEPNVSINKLFIHHAPDKANGFLWSAFGKAPHPLDILDLLPLDTALATSSDLDLANVLAGLREEIVKSGVPNAAQGFDMFLTQFAAQFGMPLEDLLKSLDGSTGLILTLDKAKPITWPMGSQPVSFPSPRLALLLRVKDDRIFNLVDKLLAADPEIQKHDTPELHARVKAAPMGPMMPWLNPTLAQWGGYLVIASDESLVKDMIAAQKTGQGLKSTPELKKLLAGLPQEGNGVQIVTPLLGDTFQALQREAMKSQPGIPPDQQALIEKLFGQTTGPVSLCSISTHLPDGWSTVSKGANGMNMLAGPGLIVPAAFAAGVALPVFGEAQERSKATRSLSNAKQLATACKLYALDNSGKFPPDLDKLVPDYLANKTMYSSPFRPAEPLGYTYTPGHTQSDPPNTILIEDKFSPEKHLRVVVRIDTSGEVIHLPKTGMPVPVP